MNQIGLDINAVGNHEFDEGADRAAADAERRLPPGGRLPRRRRLRRRRLPVPGRQRRRRDAPASPLFPPYAIEHVRAGAKVAFIGMTLEGTPTIVSPSGVAGLDFLDEADTVNALVPELEAQGVEAIVVLVHEGGTRPRRCDINGCSGVVGPDRRHRQPARPEVDLVVSGHTHQPYICEIDGIPVTSAFSFGRLVTDIDLVIDGRTSDVESITINNRIVTRDVPPDPVMTALIDRCAGRRGTDRQPSRSGSITADIRRTPRTRPASRRWATSSPTPSWRPPHGRRRRRRRGFMNPGGVRAELLFARSPAARATAS